MTEELKSLIIKLQVSNAKTENLMDNINTVKELLSQYKDYLTEEFKISNILANKIRLELLMDAAVLAQLD